VTQVETHVHDEGCCPGRHRVPRGQPCPRRQPVWCPACTADLGSVLQRLVDDVAALRQRHDGRVLKGLGAGRSGLVDLAALSVSPAFELADEALRWVFLLETRLRQHVGDAPSPHDRFLTASVRYLLSRQAALWSWDTRCEVPGDDVPGPAEAEVVGAQLQRLARRVARASGQDRLTHHLAAPCPMPDCERRTLVRRDGSDVVLCTSCGSSWPERHYQLLVRMIVEEQTRMGVLDER
jgi:ribosomal protein L37AE/L43A